MLRFVAKRLLLALPTLWAVLTLVFVLVRIVPGDPTIVVLGDQASPAARHALRNVLIPVVTVIGLYLGVLIGNAVLTEVVFNRPGLGKLIVTALNQRDYALLQGLIVVTALAIVLANILTDLAYGLVDPRVKAA